MTKKQVDKLKESVDGEWEYVIAQNNSGIDLWYDIDEAFNDVCYEISEVRRRKWATEDELDEVKDYFREQFVKNIDMRIKE